jgi:hypothetical protein
MEKEKIEIMKGHKQKQKQRERGLDRVLQGILKIISFDRKGAPYRRDYERLSEETDQGSKASHISLAQSL